MTNTWPLHDIHDRILCWYSVKITCTTRTICTFGESIMNMFECFVQIVRAYMLHEELCTTVLHKQVNFLLIYKQLIWYCNRKHRNIINTKNCTLVTVGHVSWEMIIYWKFYTGMEFDSNLPRLCEPKTILHLFLKIWGLTFLHKSIVHINIEIQIARPVMHYEPQKWNKINVL